MTPLLLITLAANPVALQRLEPNFLVLGGTASRLVLPKALKLPLPVSDLCGPNIDNERFSAEPIAEVVVDHAGPVVIANVEPMGDPLVYFVRQGKPRVACVTRFPKLQHEVNLEPGTWTVWIAPRASGGQWRLSLFDGGRPQTVAASATAQTIRLGANFVPNPLRVAVQVPTVSASVTMFDLFPSPQAKDCGQLSATPLAIAEVETEVSMDPSVPVAWSNGRGAWQCSRGQEAITLAPGRSLIHALATVAPSPATLTFRDATRAQSIDLGTARVIELPEPLTEVLSVPLRVTSPASSPSRCEPTRPPDLVLAFKAPLADVSISLVSDDDVSLSELSPVTGDGRRMKGARWACDHGGTGERSEHVALWLVPRGRTTPAVLEGVVRISTPRSRAGNPYQAVRAPQPDRPLRAREVPRYYPQVTSGLKGIDAHELWMQVSPHLVVALHSDVGALKAGTPALILYVHPVDEDAEGRPARGDELVARKKGPARKLVILVPGGATAEVSEDDLTTTWPDAWVAPPPEVTSAYELSVKEAQTHLAPADARALASKTATYEGCVQRVWDKLDPDGTAGRYDLATWRGGKLERVERLSGHIQKKAEAQCKGDAYYRFADGLVRKAAASIAASRAKQLNQELERLRALPR
jgi:hypothetical protein